MNNRVKLFETFIGECLKHLKEQGELPAPQVSASPTPPPSPPTTDPTLPPVSNDAVPPGTDQTNPEEITVDMMIERLNVLRGSKSYSDPEVYGKLTTFFNGLQPEQKTTLQSLLTQMSQIVTSIPSNPTIQPEPTVNTQPVQQNNIQQPTPPIAPKV